MLFFFKSLFSNLSLFFLLIFISTIASQFLPIHCTCTHGCDLALASFYIWQGSTLSIISQLFNTTIPIILSWNPHIPDQNTIFAGDRINIPFTCDCMGDGFLARVFNYTVQSSDTYDTISTKLYSNLTNTAFLERFNVYPANNIPKSAFLNVTVNCSCGDSAVSKGYGLFVTYPLMTGDTLQSVASANNLSIDVIRSFNPTATFNGTGLVYIPGKDQSGSYRPLASSTGLTNGAIAGIVFAVAAVFISIRVYVVVYRRRKTQKISLLELTSENQTLHASPGITVDKPIEFSYEELAGATDDFNVAYKIGQGGSGAVYYAELRGEKAAIKKMDMQTTTKFLAELKVLTHVHHLNLVRLIGYCIEGSLFLVYEYIENGNLSQHLRETKRDPLSWSTRVQIALDSARGLEYIHEHTVPVYIHRDINSTNILIDGNFHGKVAGFGLAKLIVGRSSLPTRLVGTIGYIPPEYARNGEVSPKTDVYAFGVVLYELISAKEAIVKGNSVTNSKGLIGLFEEDLIQTDPNEDLRKVIDPRLGHNYPFDSVRKMAELARACTNENPELRPSMRSIVVALMTLSSTTEDWEIDSFYGNQGSIGLMSGR